MKRKLLAFLTTTLVTFLLLFSFACNNGSQETNLTKITGVTFASAEFDYDATEKSITISGTLPDGVSVSYENNKGTNAGTYNATATLTGDGYEKLELSATLTIKKISYDMSGVSWNYSSAFTYDGNQKSVELTNLPEGVTVKQYVDGKKTNAGTYTATATFDYDTVNYNAPTCNDCEWTINKADLDITVEDNQSVKHDGNKHLPELSSALPSGVAVKYFVDGNEVDGVSTLGSHEFTIEMEGANYNKKTLTCVYKIKVDAIALASSVVNAFGNVPDAWSFLPESFATQNRTLTQAPDYTNFYSVSALPKNGIGKQLNVAYGLLNKTTKALSYVQPVYNVLSAIKNLYTEYLDNNPEQYKSFTGTTAGITFNLTLTETQYSISATVKNVAIKIFADTESGEYGAKIQLTSSTALKYTVGNSNMIVAMDILDVSATQIEFIRDENKVLGYMYEYLVAGDKQITATSTLIHSDENYTTLIGTKGDFIPTAISRNCEVYSSESGNLVGTEVREELTISMLTATYNTLWYTLDDVSGIVSIKKIDEQNVANPDTIYINNATDSIHSKLVGGNPLTNKKVGSRRFDIEFKTMYFYTYDQTEEEYKQVSCEIPMMFIQEEQIETFEADFVEKNNDYLSGSVSLNVSSTDKAAVNYGYYTLLEAYEIIKEAVTHESITNFCKA